MTTALGDLITRLEAAKDGSRELDCEIYVQINGWKLRRVGPDYDGVNDCEVYTAGGAAIAGFQYPPKGRLDRYYHVPDTRYTTSLDAALTLVPEGYDYGFSFSKQHGLEAWVQKPFKQTECFQGYAPDGDMTHKTRAKALCIAALKARGEP